MRSRNSTLILYAICGAVVLLTLCICGNQILNAMKSIVDQENARYAEIEKALGR